MQFAYALVAVLTLSMSAAVKYYLSCGATWFSQLTMLHKMLPLWLVVSLWEIALVCYATSLLLVWRHAQGWFSFLALKCGLLAYAVVNVYWAYVVFCQHAVSAGGMLGILLLLIGITLCCMISIVSRLAAFFYLAYLFFIVYGVYLNYWIWKLNFAEGVYKFL